MQVFCSSIPPSKNNFRAKVSKDQRMVGSLVSSNIEKSAVDIEMGRKPVWDDTAREALDDYDRAIRNDDNLDEDGGLADISPDLSRILPPQGLEGRSVLHSRRSSMGRKSGSWEISPDVLALAAGVGESKRVTSGNLTSETHQSQTNTKM